MPKKSKILNVEEVAKQRIGILTDLFPQLVFEDDYMETEDGVRALIRIMDRNGEVKGLEFIEPEELWSDPDSSGRISGDNG